MAARRTTYIALLAAAVALHLVYGQYLTFYMVIFLLCVPLLSLIVSIPSALKSRAELQAGEDVCRGGRSRVMLSLDSSALFPPEGWSVTVASRNEFTGREDKSQRIRVKAALTGEREFSPDTSQIGAVRYTIKRAFVFDHLGLIPIPIKKGAPVSIIVLPCEEQPVPEPDLDAGSARSFMPKRQGFSEEHELRSYREGDPLNLIHWKLSRKFGELILREPQQVVRKEIILIIDLPAGYEQHRSVLEQHCYLNSALLEKGIPYTLRYGQSVFTIASSDDYDDFIAKVLSEPMKRDLERYASFGVDALIYRIKPGGGGGV